MNDSCFVCGRDEEDSPHKEESCHQFFGEELLLAYMRPGQGLRKICQLKKGHSEEHAMKSFGDRIPHGFITGKQISEGYGC